MVSKFIKRQQVATAITFVGLSIGNNLNAQGSELPRGQNILPLAGRCNIATFPQTVKAGGYNVLCNVMPDTEKCFAFIKSHITDRHRNLS